MPVPTLETIVQTLNYSDLPETWRVPEDGCFSDGKTLYDYQTDALRNAARALYLYYGGEHDWASGETPSENEERKRRFASLYDGSIPRDLHKYERPADERNDRQNPVFKILSEYIRPWGTVLKYYNLINRMCFWMATGSGKTLVMVKLIEYLHFLVKHGEIPQNNVLVLAPSEHLLGQIRRTVEEFNRSGLHIDLVPLRESSSRRQRRLGDVATVYYHRSDNISDVQKDALTDYRTYENQGKWYVLLDEAHKGGKEDSKRQAYYAVMAREGFLFNFSATFTDREDVATTVKKYNLEEFIRNGRGKNIYLNKREYTAFRDRREEISHEERQKIVLKSLITLAYVSTRVDELREETGLDKLYHRPLMLTLVNSVNTEIENEKNDLWAFFQTLREIAVGEIDNSLFKASKAELVGDWENAELLFGEGGEEIIGTDEASIRNMTVASLRKAVFLSRRKGALQLMRGSDNRELAFQMKNAASPFALIRIGDTSKWRNTLLAGYEETAALREGSFFDRLEKSPITILMGSRSFFESWDSNRPNVVNFINIGGKDAKKFVVQSVGRGVRIETLPNQRRRLAHLPPGEQQRVVHRCRDKARPPETLFLFATNRSAVKTVLEGLETETENGFKHLEGFERAPAPKVGGRDMPLLIPEYREETGNVTRHPFSMSEGTRQRFKKWVGRTSGSVFAVRDGLDATRVAGLRGVIEEENAITIKPDKDYAMLSFLQYRVMSHFSGKTKVPDGVRSLDENKDIVHFRHIRAHSRHVRELQDKVNRVKAGKLPNQEIAELAKKLNRSEITHEEFLKRVSGKDEELFNGLKIKKLLNHYYLPVILGSDTADYIQHVIKVPSEIEFLNALEEWTRENRPPWDAWMFSKIDESLDGVHIPYHDADKNEYRRFLPDFIFWMCRKNEYRIVFVDPKGEIHTPSYRKIDAYRELFSRNNKSRLFRHDGWKVSAELFFYNPQSSPLAEYRDSWIKCPARIFAGAA